MYNSQQTLDDAIFGGNQQLKDFAHYCMNNRPIADIRKYVSLHNRELLNIGSRVLNQLIPLNGYKFLKVNGKITVSKSKASNPSFSDVNSITPSVTESVNEFNNDSAYNLHTELDSEGTILDDSMNEWKDSQYTEWSDSESIRTDNFKPSLMKPEITPAFNKSETIGSALPVKASLMISQPLDPQVHDEVMTEPVTDEKSATVKEPEVQANPDLMKHLNNLYIKELGEQQKKYDDMMSEIKQSLATKEKVETEKHQRVNTVLDAIESTYSSQSFAHIIQSIQQMTNTFITQRNEEVNALKETILSMSNEILYLKGQIETFPQIVTAIVENSSKSTLSEVNEILDQKIEDINVEIKEFDDQLKKLTLEDSEESKYTEVTKDVLVNSFNKLSEVVYTIAPQTYNNIMSK